MGPTTELMLRGAQFYADNVAAFSLHTADPGEAGSSEVVGGAYARLAVTWTVQPSGTANSSTVTFSVPDNTTIAYVGMWADDGSFLDSVAFTANFPAAGTLDIAIVWYLNYVEVV
jgi:hypothetical protein